MAEYWIDVPSRTLFLDLRIGLKSTIEALDRFRDCLSSVVGSVVDHCGLDVRETSSVSPGQLWDDELLN